MSELRIVTKTQREQIAYPASNNGLQLKCVVGLINGVFTEVVFSGIYKQGKLQEGSFIWNGNGFDVEDVTAEDRDAVTALCAELTEALAATYGFEIAVIENVEPEPPINEEE